MVTRKVEQSEGFHICFKDGAKSDCWFNVDEVEEKEKVKNDSKMFVLSKWKVGVVIYWEKIRLQEKLILEGESKVSLNLKSEFLHGK